MLDSARTYQLWIHVGDQLLLSIGALGRCRLFRGWYVYTGSARRGLRARLRRHCAPAEEKRPRWHVDYLLASPYVAIRYVGISALPECQANAEVGGAIPCPGFGASDCRTGWRSHLRYLGPDPVL